VVTFTGDGTYSYGNCGTMTMPGSRDSELTYAVVNQAGIAGSICRLYVTRPMSLVYIGDTTNTTIPLSF
jgi:hypothetical protein